MGTPHHLHTRRALLMLCAAWLLALVPALAARAEPAGTPLRLDDAQPVVPAWPALRLFSDPNGRLGADEAAAQLSRFQPPSGPTGSLGPRRDVLWLHLPLQVSGSDGAWVLDIDYPALNDVQVFLLRPGARAQPLGRLGSAQPFAQRLLPGRTHALPLSLPPGQHNLLLRVHTESAMVLPITLNKPAALQQRESRALLGQGVMLGCALALLAYALIYGLSLREPLFALYAAMLLGSTAFFADFFGVLSLALQWDRRGLAAMVSPLSVLLAMAAGAQFVTRSMEMDRHTPRLGRALQALSLLSAAVFALGVLGLIGYRQAQVIATALGPLVPLLIIPAAWQRARRGERIGRYMLFGWLSYLVGACTMAGLLRGLLPANAWTLHLFQWGTAVEMLVWLRVLGLHIEAVRLEAHRSAAERQQLQQQARTDALTGLPNRRGLQAELDGALRGAAGVAPLGLFMIDLDGFKAVNDSLGHEAGDELLVQVARRLTGQLRQSDMVARLGGDEFVVLARGVRHDGEAQLIGRKLLAALEEAFVVQGKPCHVGMTVGYALAPQDATEGAELMRIADAAMYAGKQGGRRQVRRGRVACPPGHSIAASGVVPHGHPSA